MRAFHAQLCSRIAVNYQLYPSNSDAFCGVTEAPLTAVGRQQAQQVARRLSREHIDALYCSLQGRARETAAPIASALGLQIQTREPLREMDFGEWEGRVQADVAVFSTTYLILYPVNNATFEV